MNSCFLLIHVCASSYVLKNPGSFNNIIIALDNFFPVSAWEEEEEEEEEERKKLVLKTVKFSSVQFQHHQWTNSVINARQSWELRKLNAPRRQAVGK